VAFAVGGISHVLDGVRICANSGFYNSLKSLTLLLLVYR
jgi:hypothetical protein